MIDSPPRLPGEVVGARVVLRCWVAADAPELSAAVTRNIEHLRPWMPWIAQEPLEDEERVALIETWERSWLDGGDVVFGVFIDDRAMTSAALSVPGVTFVEIHHDTRHISR